MIVGKLVNLRSVERSDLPFIVKWRNDPEVMRWWHQPSNCVSLGEAESWYQEMVRRRDDREVGWIIETTEGRAIGQIFYRGLSRKNHTAEVAIIIGEKDCWSQGLGSDAMRTFLGYAFDEMRLHRVWLSVQSSNKRAIQSYKKCGFVEEGVARESVYFEGHFEDSLHMSILDREYSQGMKRP